MIDVGVRENDRVQVLDGQRQLPVFLRGFLALSLKHSAIQGDGAAIHAQKMAGSGHLACSTDEGDLQTANLPLPRHAERESLSAARPGTLALAPSRPCSAHSADR